MLKSFVNIFNGVEGQSKANFQSKENKQQSSQYIKYTSEDRKSESQNRISSQYNF